MYNWPAFNLCILVSFHCNNAVVTMTVHFMLRLAAVFLLSAVLN
jgi:hypothetical protein